MAARKAIRHFDARKGGQLRAGSKRYNLIVNEIAAAADPMAKAEAILKRIAKAQAAARTQSLAEKVRAICAGANGKVSTAELDEVVAAVRAGFPGGRLDPQHYRIIERYEREEVFTGRATPKSLQSLADLLTRIQVFDPQRQTWGAWRAPN